MIDIDKLTSPFPLGIAAIDSLQSETVGSLLYQSTKNDENMDGMSGDEWMAVQLLRKYPCCKRCGPGVEAPQNQLGCATIQHYMEKGSWSDTDDEEEKRPSEDRRETEPTSGQQPDESPPAVRQTVKRTLPPSDKKPLVRLGE